MSETNISQQYTDQPEAAYRRLRDAVSKLKFRSDLFRYFGGALSWLASVLLVLTILAYLSGIEQLPSFVRVFMLIIFMAFVLWTGYIFIGKTIIRRTSVERMAFRIEQNHPELQDRLISSLQLWPELSENRYGYSKKFINRVVEEATESLGGVSRSKVLEDDLKKLKSGLMMIAVLIPIAVIIAVSPSTFQDSINAFVHPLADVKPPVPVEIVSVIPGDHTVQPGESVEIIAEATGSVPPTAILHHRTGAEEWHTISINAMEEKADDMAKTVFSTKLSNVKESLDYYVSVAKTQSKQYSISVIQKPIVDSLQLELRYPRYTGLPSKSLDENIGDVVAPPGTRVGITVTTSKDTASAFIVFDGGETKTRLEIAESRKIKGNFLIQKSGLYHIAITDTDGQTNSDPIEYSINALADQPPRISIAKPGEDITVGEDMVIQLQIEAQDDYGVAKIDLNYQIEGQDEKYSIQLWDESPQTVVSLAHTWNLDSLQLFPEDVITYYAEATDADNISGPNTGRSMVYVARFPSLYELYKQTEMEQEMEQMEMEDIRTRQDEVKDMVDDLIDELKKEKELDWSGKKELEKAAEMQKKIEEQMEKLSQEIEETVEKIEKNPLIGTEALEKIEELRQLIQEVATDEMKHIMKELSEALKEVNPSQQQKDLMNASFKQEELMEKLDSMIDLFKKMQLQQKMEVAANQAGELVKQQKETIDQTEAMEESGLKDSDKAENLAEREERIKDQTEQLLADLDKIAEEMKEKFPKIADFVKKSTQKAQKGKIPEQMEMASQQLKNMNTSESLPHQCNALTKLSQLQSELQEAVEAMEGQDMAELVAVLQDAIRSSLYLSHQHEELMKAMAEFEGDPQKILPGEKRIIDSIAADEIDLASGAQKVAKNLSDLSHETTSVRPELGWSMELVADGMKRSAAAMEDKLPSLVKPIQRNTLATLNNAIENMLKSIDQISANATPMMGMEDYMNQLRQLADQQSQLNQSTQDASSMQRRQGRTPSVEQMLEKLAVEQSLIREATERLAGKLDELAEALGRLEEVAKEMREVEENLGDGSLSRQTVERQRRILTRLLEYEKSLKKQDLSKKREARAGRAYAAERPSSTLPADATEIKKQLDTMNSPSAQQRWPAQYRELIRMYYKALSNTVKTQSGAER